MLARSTIAGQEGVITYLANAAALQQFEQTALAYVLMSEAGRSMGAPGLAAAAESLLEGKFEVLHSCHPYVAAHASCLMMASRLVFSSMHPFHCMFPPAYAQAKLSCAVHHPRVRCNCTI